MSGNAVALIELLLIVGGLAWFGVSQLRSLKRFERRREDKVDDEGTDKKSVD